MEENIGAHLFVSGKVQGVFYRKHAQQKAKEFGLTGWVHNLIDGRVEISVEGEKEHTEQFILWAKEGSPFAQVEDVRVEWKPYEGKWNDFEVREFGF
ncbi:MAG: acylphosphatase [bacterium]|nr:acylphosphatase [bacterium]